MAAIDFLDDRLDYGPRALRHTDPKPPVEHALGWLWWAGWSAAAVCGIVAVGRKILGR